MARGIGTEVIDGPDADYFRSPPPFDRFAVASAAFKRLGQRVTNDRAHIGDETARG